MNVTPSVMFDKMRLTLRTMSATSITLTFGKRSTIARWKRERSGSPVGPSIAPTKVCGAFSSAPGRKSIRKPVRELRQSTRRTLVTRAVSFRPCMSNVIVPPRSRPAVPRMSSSIETSGSADGVASQNLPATIVSLYSRFGR